MHGNVEMHPVPGSELCVRRSIQNESGRGVEGKRVAVCRDFDAPGSAGSSILDGIGNEIAGDASAHPVWIDEQIIELIDVAHRTGCREPDDVFVAEGDTSSLLSNWFVVEHECVGVREKSWSVAFVGERGLNEHIGDPRYITKEGGANLKLFHQVRVDVG